MEKKSWERMNKIEKKEDEPGWKNFERNETGKKNIVTWEEKRKATKWAEKTLYVIRMDGLKLEKKNNYMELEKNQLEIREMRMRISWHQININRSKNRRSEMG